MNSPLPCVRCGRRPRLAELFLCGPCQADPVLREELRKIEEGAIGYVAQRRLAVERFAWAGGWRDHPTWDQEIRGRGVGTVRT